MSISIIKGDLTKIVCDAVVNPANSLGYMGGGAAGALKRAGGIEIEKEARSKAPIKIGKAVITTAGNLPCRFVVHSPTMNKPAMRIDIKNVSLATTAALELGIKKKLKTIAIPGMGTGVGGIPVDIAAKTIVDIAKKYENKFEKIILIDRDQSMINAFEVAVKK